jgi:hypothetical protein
MRHIIIGDVHGCLPELQELINTIFLKTDDRLYFIGDLIDRGPDSAGVVSYVRRLAETMNVVLILGNHEEKFLRYLHHKKNNDPALKQMKDTEQFRQLSDQLVHEDIQFLQTAYLNYHISETNICLLHGGIPGTNKVDLSVSYLYDIHLFKSVKGTELILKTRFLDESGNFVSFDKENERSVFWAETYDGRYGKVIFGHHAVLSENPQEYPHAVNIDTACVYGGWLNACLIEDGNLSYKHVKALQTYATR